jgi:HD domain-containing protein
MDAGAGAATPETPTMSDGPKLRPEMTLSEKADAVEEHMLEQLNLVAAKSVLFTSGEKDPTQTRFQQIQPGQRGIMADDPRLPKMPKQPTLVDFFKYRFSPSQNHLLQSAALAKKNGHSEKIILACLLHDIGVAAFIRADHGYWGAQLLEPYVDEEVSWAIRAHQALRFYPDESVGYEYPQMYVRNFGADYTPEPYIQRAYEEARNHKWYMTGRLITLNDLYAFDPNAVVNLDDFVDIIGRNFKQPEEGLGFDNSPSAHMWRTIMWPTRFL